MALSTEHILCLNQNIMRDFNTLSLFNYSVNKQNAPIKNLVELLFLGWLFCKILALKFDIFNFTIGVANTNTKWQCILPFSHKDLCYRYMEKKLWCYNGNIWPLNNNKEEVFENKLSNQIRNITVQTSAVELIAMYFLSKKVTTLIAKNAV